MARGESSGPGHRPRARLVGPTLLVLALLFLLYAGAVLKDRADAPGADDGPLQVRTDLMRGQPCHAEGEAIMGDCTPEQIRMLQREAELRLAR